AMTLADRVVVMNDGRIEQVGPPQELYHSPKTRFVAGFIGSPAMNFLPCKVVAASDGLAARIGADIVLPIPPERRERYASFQDKDMLVGIRPEHITDLVAHPSPGQERLDITVDVVEPMGNETMVHFRVGTHAVCARVDPGTPARANQPLPLHVNMNNMHLIEQASGRVV
ncbi:MAG: TOBE domain-containing protein, partial [Gammaproteobacteria bacterium]|nr:TOBE domain-containing protein [Gammaproteobacteria bacterium]